MKREYPLSGWLGANLVLLIVGMLIAWFALGFEPHPSLKLISGWDFILTQLATSIELLFEYSLGWLWILSFLQGVGGIFVMGYVVVKIIRIVKLKSPMGSKVISITLIGIGIIFLFRDLLYRLNLPLPGYWLFILGLFSSAIFEWRHSMMDR
jgi:hypothetical protein